MKICLLGEYSGNLDEGMRKASYYFAKEMVRKHDVLALDLRDVFSESFWKHIRNFGPEIVHYIHGPTIKSFVLLKIISEYCRDAKSVMSAMRPFIPYLLRGLIPLIKPNLILTQSSKTEKMLRHLECKTEFLPIGVDINKFIPVSEGTKKELRCKYGINEAKFIILHVGSIKKGRNVELLTKLQKDDCQVLMVASMSTGIDSKIHQHLVNSGCIIWSEYMKNIEEVYAMSDCYVYPTVERYDLFGRSTADSIEMPLTVLEAMACNLPVITTKFGALPRIFQDGDGFYLAETEENFICALEFIRNSDTKIQTRRQATPYSWQNIIQRLEGIYEELIDDGNK